MVLWVLSLRNGFPVGVPTITHKMSLLAHPIYSKDILNILPLIISQVPDGDFKILIQSQMLDKRAKFFTDFIILSGTGKSSILGTFEEKDVYIIVPVFSTREGRRSDPTRRAVTREEFEELDNLLFKVEYNNHLYGIRKADLDDIKKRGLVGLIDIPIGEQGLRSLLAKPHYHINPYCIKYDTIEDAKKFLLGRQKKSGESKKMTKERIKKALVDQHIIESYQDIFKDVFLVKEWKEFVGFLSKYGKKMV